MTEGSEERELGVVEEGWYPDPDDSRGRWLRHWDGEDWSDTPAKLASATERKQMTWPAASDGMQALEALSYGDKWRVNRLVAKGEAPRDPRMAAAAVELAERYQRRKRVDPPTLTRLVAIALTFGGAALAILAAAKGDAPLTIAMAVLALTNVGHLAFNPALRPANVARSLEASRRIIASGTQSST